MKTLLLLMSGVVACSAAEPANIAGDWSGTLKTSGTELRLVLHLQKAGDAWKATLDSVDQGSHGIPVAKVTVEGNHLHLDVDAVKGTYAADLSADGKALTGRWKQGELDAPLNMTRGDISKVADPNDKSVTAAPLAGIWEGALEARGMKLRVRLILTKNDSGQMIGKFDSIDQGATGIPISGIVLNGSDFHFDLPAARGKYDGKVTEDKRTIKGTWDQGAPLPLEWNKVDKPTALIRPQEPKRPYPYKEEEVSYPNKTAPGVELAGTLTLPSGAGPFPAVVLISGSGPQDRDETLMGHKPFLVLADHLTRKGIAVLRFDDRGFGRSKGAYSKATSADFATDALAGVEYLKTRSEINKSKIGLVGHSEGGMIGPLAAVQSNDVGFLVLIAGPGDPADKIMKDQLRLLMKAAGRTDAEIAKAADQQARAFAVVRTEPDAAVAREKLKEVFAGGSDLSGGGGEASLGMLASPWFRYFLAYQPTEVLKKVKVPVLAVNGELDLQVEPVSNLAAIRDALDKAGNRNVTISQLPGLNHLLQTAKTGSVTEYATIEETMNPTALELISSWILKTTGQASPAGSNR